MNTILERILADKRREITERKALQPIGRFGELFPALGPPAPFIEAVRAGRPGVIAEIKRRSPSAGVIRDPFDPALIALAYERHGAAAISCLMDYPYFGGGDDDFETVRKAIRLPMLYKEFVVDPWQLHHARALGASAVLLIVAALEADRLHEFLGLARELQLCPLVEAHTATELAIALEGGAECIGINNRDLNTFETRLQTTLDLAAQVPDTVTLISESGIKTAQDAAKLRAAGIHGMLVGEGLLREPDPGEALSRLLQPID